MCLRAFAWVCAEVKIMARKLEGPSHQLIDKICDKTEGALWPLIMAQLANWRWHRRHTFSRCARIVVDIHYDGHYHQDLIDYQMAVSIKIFLSTYIYDSGIFTTGV